jgi:transglutaminase-like putative cysteine protease
MVRYRITHTTKYAFSKTVSLCKGEAHLTPRNFPNQHCEFHQLVIRPLAEVTRPRQDGFGNQVSYFEVHEPHLGLEVTGISVVRVGPSVEIGNPRFPPEAGGTSYSLEEIEIECSTPWEEVRSRLEETHSKEVSEARQFVSDSTRVTTNADLADYAGDSFRRDRPILDAAHHLMGRIYKDFVYDPGSSAATTSLKEVIKQRRGVCQDFAHIAIGCLRSLGLAARYVSGYLDTAALRGAGHRIASDASHAWFSLYEPEVGWVAFDPTNGRMPADGYITTAWGRDYDDVAPLKGTFTGGGTHRMEVAVDVARIQSGSSHKAI